MHFNSIEARPRLPIVWKSGYSEAHVYLNDIEPYSDSPLDGLRTASSESTIGPASRAAGA